MTPKTTPKQRAINKLAADLGTLHLILSGQNAPLIRARAEKLMAGEDPGLALQSTTPEIEAVEAKIRALDPDSMLLPENADEYNY